MQDKLIQMTGVLALVIAALGYLALRGWRGAVIAQQKLLPALPEVPQLGASDTLFDCQYVVTTVADEPLNRVKAHGLGHRGKAQVRFAQAATDLQPAFLVIERTGEQTLAIAADRLVDVALTNATLDRAVEKDGLVRVRWTENGHSFDTYLRVMNSDLRQQLMALPTSTQAKTA